jgi:hypothetical protein
MATKKKSKVIESAEVAEMVNMPAGGWPRIEQGSHLTVIYHEDGKSELKWDDEALRNEVNAAILSVNQQETENGDIKNSKQSQRQTNKSK